MKTFNLQNKNIFLTGAQGYLGKQLYKALCDEGANIFPVDVNCNNHAEYLDITNSMEVDKYINSNFILNNKKVDIIINNAAVSFKGNNISPDQFMKTMNVNVAAVDNIIKAFGVVLEKDASIVNIASLYGFIAPNFKIYDGDPELYSSSAYNCSKAALIQMTKYYAAQLAPIRVNSVSPGGICQNHNTEFNDKYSERVPLRRMAMPDDVINAVLFLASGLSSYITGANIPVTGGIEIW